MTGYDAERRRAVMRVRHGLRKRLQETGLSFPKDLRIRCRPTVKSGQDGRLAIDFVSAPGSSESTSMHSHAGEYGGTKACLERIVDLGVGHVRRLRRIRTREEALRKNGHDPRQPPRHALETHPIIALAVMLVDQGLAGISGSTRISTGRLLFDQAMIHLPGQPLRISTDEGFRMQFAADLPETVILALAGKPVAAAIAMPACGRPHVDDAVAKLRIREASAIRLTPDFAWVLRKAGQDNEHAVSLLLDPCPVVEIDPTPPGEDGSWKKLDPLPEL